jgi:ABC-type Mn2+/Zn2+ transport system ATPase subunit
MTHTAARAVGAEHLLGRRVGECSTGQRRRLMIAGALAGRFPVLLLDEPLEDLDAWGRDAVAAVVRDWTGEGGVVIMAAPSAAELPPAGRTIMLGAEGSTA